MSGLRDQLLQTANDVIARVNSITSAEVWKIGRTADATHTIFPSSLGIPPSMDNDTLGKILFDVVEKTPNWAVRQMDGATPIIDVEQRLIVLRLFASGDTEFGPFNMQYILNLKTTDDGKLVKESWEFLDSHQSLKTSGRA
ncbi:unnamed protein product [Clonostachys rhizophaga]|uniref:SnoaL-like domain-containing protein n=1 Tax=Clonostachys rhizophaga TaxID=160324 RepID=A0A9N9YS44_9HYPO|nr:unnamed protein product [Clonostachys rhizophaga]